jgi:hypothetical protein
MRMAHQLRGAKKLTLQQFSPAHTLDPGCSAIVPYPESRIRAMQEGVNSIIKGDFLACQPDASCYLQAG